MKRHTQKWKIKKTIELVIKAERCHLKSVLGCSKLKLRVKSSPSYVPHPYLCICSRHQVSCFGLRELFWA